MLNIWELEQMKPTREALIALFKAMELEDNDDFIDFINDSLEEMNKYGEHTYEELAENDMYIIQFMIEDGLSIAEDILEDL